MTERLETRKAEGPCRVDLAVAYGFDSSPQDLRSIGAEVDHHRRKRGLVRSNGDSKRRQREVHDEDLNQEGSVPDRLDIGGDRPEQRTGPGSLAICADGGNSETEGHRQRRKPNGQPSPFAELVPVLPDDVAVKGVVHAPTPALEP